MKKPTLTIVISVFISACAITTSSPGTPAYASMHGMLEAHNRVRAAHRLPLLTWSPQLATYSQDWANYLAANNRCKMKHRSVAGKDFGQFGENLFWASPQNWSDGRLEAQPVTASEVANAWAEEIVDYSYSRNSCRPGKQCGHYTQMVWRDTKQVGCAMTLCNSMEQLWVCSYNPPGNWIGQPPY